MRKTDGWGRNDLRCEYAGKKKATLFFEETRYCYYIQLCGGRPPLKFNDFNPLVDCIIDEPSRFVHRFFVLFFFLKKINLNGFNIILSLS